MSTSPLLPQPDQNDSETQSLPSVTQATIQRAKQGVAYARDRHAHKIIQQALKWEEAFTQAKNGSERKISGEARQGVLRSLIHTLFRVKVDFPERIPKTPALIAANHLNHIDPLLLLAELPPHPYYHVLGDARTLYNQWWKRQFLALSEGVIPLERIWKEEVAVIAAAKAGREDLTKLAADIEKYVPQGNSIETLRKVDRMIQGIFERGEGIILFPEGRLGDTEGQLFLPLKRGAAIYALRAGVPILPVAIIGTQELYLRKELTVRFGKPLIFPQSHRPKAKEAQAVTDKLEAALIELLPTDYQEADEPKCFRRFLNRMFW